MPIIASAKKKMRQDKVRQKRNLVVKKTYKQALKKTQSAVGKAQKGALNAAYAAVDKAVKHGIIHKNKAARLKSRVARAKKEK